jgi:hypothetical protein
MVRGAQGGGGGVGEAGELIERARVWGPWPVGVPCEQVGCCERGTGLPLVGITSEFKTERCFCDAADAAIGLQAV